MHGEGLQICSSIDESSHIKEFLHKKQVLPQHLALLEGCFKCSSWDVKTEGDCLKGKCLVYSCHYWGLLSLRRMSSLLHWKISEKNTTQQWLSSSLLPGHSTALILVLHSVPCWTGTSPKHLSTFSKVPSWWNILSQIPMHGYDWKRRPEREVLCFTLDLWRQFEGILQQEANSQGQAGPKGRGVAKASEWEQFYSYSSSFSKNPKVFHMDGCFHLPNPEYHTSTEWEKRKQETASW